MITVRCVPLGEAALLVEATGPQDFVQPGVLALAERVKDVPLHGIRAVVPGIGSLLVHFDPRQTAHAAIEQSIQALLQKLPLPTTRPVRIVEIGVRYGGVAGPDLDDVAATLGIAQRDVVALHIAPIYRVLIVGFAPGFPYLGPLPTALHLPRRSTPRTAVPAGSVAIAADYAGIYPARLPGGWHLLGRTETLLFDPQRESPALLRPGDGVKFVPLADGVQP